MKPLFVKGKRGQLTAIILIGLVIFILATLLIYFRFFYQQGALKIGAKELAVPTQLKPLDAILEKCATTTLEEGLILIGLQGGYVTPPKLSLKTKHSKIAYWYYNGKKHIPTKKTIEKQLNNYLDFNMQFCFNKKQFPQFQITTKEPTAKTTINKEQVTTTITYSITATKEKAKYELNKKYKTKINIPLGNIHATTKNIIENEIKKPGSIDMSHLLDLDYDVAILPKDDNHIVYSITDTKNKLKGKEYTFILAYFAK